MANTEKIPFKKRSLIFAPMEGVTNGIYRKTIRKLYPEWDALCADFIRVPSNGLYPTKFLVNHIGQEVLDDPEELKRTMVQILTSPRAKTMDTVKQLVDLGIYWMDLNVGCPSGTVVKHQGGSYWLKNVSDLLKLVGGIRKLHPHFFSVKMRLGFDSTVDFQKTVEALEKEGIDALIVHARTREQMYKDKANWDFIKLAVDSVSIPVIGNGDIWTLNNVENIFEQTNCHSAMIARGALKKPWLVKDNSLDEKEKIKQYFSQLIKIWKENEVREQSIIKKIKEFSRYIFDDMVNGPQIKRRILLAQDLGEQESILLNL